MLECINTLEQAAADPHHPDEAGKKGEQMTGCTDWNLAKHLKCLVFLTQAFGSPVSLLGLLIPSISVYRQKYIYVHRGHSTGIFIRNTKEPWNDVFHKERLLVVQS